MQSKKFLLIFFLLFKSTASFCQTYQFIGNGNWDISINWKNNLIPPAVLPDGDSIIISPNPGDSCVLNTFQIISPNAFLIIGPNTKFIIANSVSSIPTTAICNKIWMKKNLDVVTYRNGDTIPQISNPTLWNSATTGAWRYPNNDPSLGPRYGKLYNWYAINDHRGLAPAGWHVPSKAEWENAINCLGGRTVAGGALKDTSSTYWPDLNTGATNSSGFSAIPSGAFIQVSYDIDYYVFFWANSENGLNNPYYTQLYYDSTTVNLKYLNSSQLSMPARSAGMAIRCVWGETPTIKTDTADLSATSIVAKGLPNSDGGSPVIEKGFVWDANENPTIALSTKLIAGSGMGNYNRTINALSPNLRYHLRAYAINASGISYGNDIVFTTPMPNTFPSDTLICGKRWTTRNLSVSNYRNGDPIPEVRDRTQWASLTSGAWCWYNNDSATYGPIYGKLYNWYAVNDPRGLAPAGWHIPSDTEWTDLINCQGGSDVAGGLLKEVGFTHWNSPNTGATNASGFTGLPGGITVAGNGQFTEVGFNGHWWSSKDYPNSTSAIFVTLRYDNSTFNSGYSNKNQAMSIRCIKD